MTPLRALLVTCSLSQVCCAPIIYELGEQTTDAPASSTEPSPTGDPEPTGADTMDPLPPPGPCRRWDCDPKTGCVPVPDAEGEPCDDGFACTVGELCVQGECIGKEPQPLLTTDFSAADGWSTDALWAIGPAKPSKCAEAFLGDDPFQDHSPGADELLAGAVIGGCLPNMGFPLNCLSSPPIDVKDAPGGLWLRYWSVLNTAGAPMESRIDVFDPKLQAWSPIAKFPEFTAEPGWTEHLLDLTPYLGPGLRVRFCHAAPGPVPPIGGWSLDDISIGPPMCD